MKKVLFIVSSLVRSGPTQQMFYLCKYLPAFGYQPIVLTLSPNPEDNLLSQFQDQNVELHSLGLSRLGGVFKAKNLARKKIQELQPDIIHTSGIRSDELGHSISKDIPHVMTLRNYAWDDYPKKFGLLKGGPMAITHLSLVKRSQAPVACSHTLAKRLRHYRDDISAIPNGIDTEIFSPIDLRERPTLKESLGFNSEKRLILSLGALIQRKNPACLLDAFLSSHLKDSSELCFLGEGPLEEFLKEKAKGQSSVLFRGQVHNVRDYLHASDLMVSTSRSEGLPNSVLEALACGVPVVLSDIDPHVEIGVDECDAGAMAKLDDPSDFVRKMELVLTRDLAELSENSRYLVENRFSAEHTASLYAKIYNELI